MALSRLCLWAAASTLLLARGAHCWTAPQALVESIYSDKLAGDDTQSVSGYLAVERFAPLPRSELQVVLTVAGVQRRTAFVLPNGAWAFHHVPAGTHALDVVAAGFEVPTVRVDVSGLQGRVRFSPPLAPEQALRAPLVLGPTSRVAYADPVVGWSLRYFLQNPMYLVMGVMGLFALFMPRLMEGMDPEELKLMQEQMGKGGLTAMLTGSAEAPKPKPKPKPAAGRIAGGGGPAGAPSTSGQRPRQLEATLD